jgi:addiction module HigA family antidote
MSCSRYVILVDGYELNSIERKLIKSNQENAMTVPKKRETTHPGEMLLREFLIPMGLTQKQLADGIKVPFQRINQIVSGKRGITPSTALRLGKYFGMSAAFWTNLQTICDLQAAEKAEREILRSIRPQKRRSIDPEI